MGTGRYELDGHVVEVSSADRVVFPEAGLTKGDVVDYYARIAERMLPWIDGRPIALKRWTRGLSGASFFQKQAGEHFPDWIRRHQVPKRGGVVDHVVVDHPATIVYLANQGTIEFHAWLACADDLDRPDQLIVDLDPPAGADVELVRSATRRVRDLLDELGVQGWLKTSGSKGYHVHVPIERGPTWAEVEPVRDGIARVLAARHPDELTDEFHIAERDGRVFVDTLRNAYAQTAVVAYSVRGRARAPVATPIGWDELGRAEPDRYTIVNLFRRLGQLDDPWSDWREQPFERLRALTVPS